MGNIESSFLEHETQSQTTSTSWVQSFLLKFLSCESHKLHWRFKWWVIEFNSTFLWNHWANKIPTSLPTHTWYPVILFVSPCVRQQPTYAKRIISIYTRHASVWTTNNKLCEGEKGSCFFINLSLAVILWMNHHNVVVQWWLSLLYWKL